MEEIDIWFYYKGFFKILGWKDVATGKYTEKDVMLSQTISFLKNQGYVKNNSR